VHIGLLCSGMLQRTSYVYFIRLQSFKALLPAQHPQPASSSIL